MHMVGGDPRVAGSLSVECYGSFARTWVEGVPPLNLPTLPTD